MSAEVAAVLVEIGAVGFQPQRPVRFKSGMLSPVYCDNRKFPFHPKAWGVVIRGFEALLRGSGVPCDVIAGVESAGIPHSAALGFATGLPSVFIRKEAKQHGTKKRVEGGDVRGQRVLLIEDLITTGVSSLAAVAALRAEGAEVTDCAAIVSYGMEEAQTSFAQAGVRIHALATFTEILAAAAAAHALHGDQVAVIEDWLREPHGWARRHGLEVAA